MSDSLHQKYQTVDAERGTIYSEEGQMLSTSIPTFDIFIDFNADGLREKKGKRFYENVDSFAISLSSVDSRLTPNFSASFKRTLS